MFSLRMVDEDYVNRPGGKDAGSGLWVLLVLSLAVMVGFVVWAALFEIEEVTRASGRVIPSSQIQSVQYPEDGVVSVIKTREGEIVEFGQILFYIDDTSVQSRLGELEQRYQALSSELVRLRAEAQNSEHLSFPKDHGLNARVVQAEIAIFDTRRKQLSIELNVLRDLLAQRQAEHAEFVARRNRLNAVVAPLRREVEISEGLFQEGTISEIEMLRLRSELAKIEGDLFVMAASEQRALASIAEVETRIISAQSAYGLTAQERISVVLGDLAVVEESLTAARNRVSRAILRSPVRGTINRVNVANVGSVVQPGMVLAEIVPLDDTLLIEAEVSPRDVAFVRVGASASVKITAFDYLRYGDLSAQVERIGADALQTVDGIPYFRVVLRTDKTALTNQEGETLGISPGMIASVDIQSGEKTVLQYLVQPILRAQHEALRER